MDFAAAYNRLPREILEDIWQMLDLSYVTEISNLISVTGCRCLIIFNLTPRPGRNPNPGVSYFNHLQPWYEPDFSSTIPDPLLPFLIPLNPNKDRSVIISRSLSPIRVVDVYGLQLGVTYPQARSWLINAGLNFPSTAISQHLVQLL